MVVWTAAGQALPPCCVSLRGILGLRKIPVDGHHSLRKRKKVAFRCYPFLDDLVNRGCLKHLKQSQ